MLSLDKSDYLDGEYDDDGSDSRSADMFSFPLRFYDSVGRVRGVGSGFFFPVGIKSIGDVVTLLVFVPIGVESKGGRLIEIFWHPKS